MIPAGFSDKSRELLAQSGHRGEVVEMPPGPHALFPGGATVTFDQPIFLQTRGEQVLYVNLEGKGIVTITGCCHPGVLPLLQYAREHFEGFEASRGYGGCTFPFEGGPPQTAGKLEATGSEVRATCTRDRVGNEGRGIWCRAPPARQQSDLYPGKGPVVF